MIPTEYRADAVVVLTVADKPVLAVVVEVQRTPDPRKRRSWPVYVTTVQARLGCPAELLVVRTERALAAWCATPIPIGVSGSQITPSVLGPDLVPVVTDPAAAGRAPEMAVLSAVAHGGDPNRRAVLDVLSGRWRWSMTSTGSCTLDSSMRHCRMRRGRTWRKSWTHAPAPSWSEASSRSGSKPEVR